MEEGKKNCPYCGEEIMAAARKCKHCGEWLDKPIETVVCPVCGEANHGGTEICMYCNEPLDGSTTQEEPVFQTDDLRTNFMQSLTEKSSIPFAIVLYTLVCYIGGYASGAYSSIRDGLYGLLNLLPYTSLLSVGIVLWIGFAYSKKLTDASRTRATLRAWLALEVGYIWWAAALVLACMFAKLDLLTDCEGWLQVSYILMYILAVGLWLVLKYIKKVSLDEMVALFNSSTIVATIITTMAVIIQFGPTSYYPGFHF